MYNQAQNQTRQGRLIGEADTRAEQESVCLAPKENKSIIKENFARLDKLITKNTSLILELETRLKPVLAPTQPAMKQQEAKEANSPIPMVASLENFCGAIETNNNLIIKTLEHLGI